MGLLQFSGINFIVLRDRSMNTVNNRLRFPRQMCDPEGTTFALNPLLRNINNLGHDMLQILVDHSRGIPTVRPPGDARVALTVERMLCKKPDCKGGPARFFSLLSTLMH